MSLSINNHDRNIAGLTYIYPVLSRRSGGLSIGINFNTNNACNWRCLYCQVPELKFGKAPELDFALLESELCFFLDSINSGKFYQRFPLAQEQRKVKDIAISGNGEPCSLAKFDLAIQLIVEIASSYGLFPASNLVLISNGSLMYKPEVKSGLAELAKVNGELWFKIDSASESGRKLINNTALSQQRLLANLQIASHLCTTKIQTCMINYHQQLWTTDEKQAYLQLLTEIQQLKMPIHQIMLYSLARESMQAEAAELQKFTGLDMQEFANDIKLLGFTASVNE